MDRDIILKLIQNADENDCVDFKREFYLSLKQSDLAKDVSAFANLLNNEDKMKCEIQKLKETIEDTQYEKSFNIELYDRIATTIHSSKGLQYNQVIINSDNFIYNNELSNSEVHYVAITRPEERLLVLFKQGGRKAEMYYRAISERARQIEVEGIQQSAKDIMQIENI